MKSAISRKEFTFQAIISLIADSEEDARMQLHEELKANEQAHFKLVLELDVEADENGQE